MISFFHAKARGNMRWDVGVSSLIPKYDYTKIINDIAKRGLSYLLMDMKEHHYDHVTETDITKRKDMNKSNSISPYRS